MTTEDMVIRDAENVVDAWETKAALEVKDIREASAALFRAIDELSESVAALRRERV